MISQNFDYSEDDFQKDFQSGAFELRTEEGLLQESEERHKVWDAAVYESRAKNAGIEFVPLDESRQQEAALIGNGFEVRSLQEWFHEEEKPDPEFFGASLQLLGAGWVLIK